MPTKLADGLGLRDAPLKKDKPQNLVPPLQSHLYADEWLD